MKIEKIIIENINSIEKAEISFSAGILANEPLFLITGETGSGKSTILDAITLALYDKSPRYENTKNKEKTENGLSTMQSTTNALRKGTFDGKAEVWFNIGNESYIATWQMHRTRNGKYDMTNRRKLEVVKGEEKIVVETKIDAVNQQVTELIGLTYDQFVRSVMLAQGQFNTFLTSEKAKQTEILEMLTGTEVYSKIAELVGRHKNDAKNDVDKATELYNSLNKNILSDKEIAELNAELAKNEKLLSKNEQEIKTVEVKIRNFEKLEVLDEEIDGLKSQLADLQASYEKILDEKETLKHKRDELKKQIDELAGNSSIAKQMSLIMSVLDNEFSENSAIYDIKEAELSEISNMLGKAETAQKQAQAAYEKCNDDFAKTNLNKLIADYNEHKKELAHQEERKTTCIRVGQILKEYNFKKQFIDTKREELIDLRYNFKESENDFSSKESVFKTKDAEYLAQKSMVDDYIKALRAKLKDGEPCPLCGSTSHQYHDEKIVDSLFATIENNWNDARDAFEKAKDVKNKAEASVKNAMQVIDNEEKLIKNLDDELKKLCNGNPIYDLDKLQKGQMACDEKIAAEGLIIKEINEKIIEAQNIQKNLQKLHLEKNNADEAYKTLLKKLAAHWKRLNDNYSKVDSDIVKIDEITNGIKRIEGIERIEEFKGKNAVRNDIDKNSILIGFTKVLTNLISKSDERKAVVKDTEGVDKTENLKTLETLETQRKTLNATLSEFRAKLSLNAQNTASAQAAKDDLQAKTAQLSLWTQLASAIGTTASDNFRDVAQAYTMRILLDQANYFLRKLSQRYELTCYSNSLAIMVMDKEMGGELRSASSLSGGETFLVSLALALGLASLNDENLNIDMLFIDEGFGTLDGESLEMAVTALGNMQKFGKKVGIISHVDSLKERIPAQILVTKRGKAASSVEIKKS